ncbi:hypothetical protein AWW73_17910 [Acinetobacter lactucae]|uniref:hypothetical protein n=1 Tax=Acinetobacter lactucae TaxID=1785128 RepID=UPI0007A02D5B|nr:hypothetical protein [Acinetobacter lactucae]KYQ79751.1 hypothetical protein AWW73_17910 [Acinetobacter lactucae]
MIKPDWEIFSAKFSSDKELTFEWFTYLLFCREFNLPRGWFGFKNQSGIEKNPIKYNGEIIGFQSKFYSTKLSEHKDDLIETLNKVKRDYPELTKLLFYTNQIWGQAYSNVEKRMIPPQALVDIENKAKELGISLEWRETSFFESEFVCLEHDDLSKYFFTEQAQHGWQRFDDWSNTKSKLEEEYFIDDNVKVISPNHQQNSELNVVDGINEIRKKLSSSNSSVRLVGLSGVGKTRFAQALFDERIGENSLDHRQVWYCDLGDSPIPMPEHFIEELIQKNKSYILIVDNCGQDTHANLTRKVQNSQITLMTIEYDVKDDLPERTDVYKLKPISVEIVQKVIERHYPHINDLNSRKIAEFAGGNYRLALAIASNIERTDNLALLTDKELFERLFWQQGHVNEELLKVAQNFALVYSFNIEDSGEENSELDFLAGLARVDADTAIEAIENLKNKDIVQQRGKWRAILPHALANHLAKELISTKLVSKINEFTAKMPVRLQTSFIKRLSYLHDVPKVKELANLWLSNNGWLGENILNDSYDSQDLVKIRLLSLIAEDQLLALIEQKHALDKKFLTRENLHFVELSRLVRSLAYQKHNFKDAFKLLIYFAKDEKENERNNSIRDLVTSLFRLYTSETLADLEQKKEILNELKSQEVYQSILLDCISIALNFHEYGYFIRESTESGKSSDYGYHPKTYEEILSWVDFLLEILNELDIRGIAKARTIFVNHLKEIIWTCGETETVKKHLEIFNKRSFFVEAHNKILNIIKWNTDELKSKAPKILEELSELEIDLRPNKSNISELIKSYIFVPDYKLDEILKDSDEEDSIKIPEFDSYEHLINYISKNLQNIEVLKENLELLISANSGWVENNYLIKLGENSAQVFTDSDQFMEYIKFLNIEKQLRSSEFLLGILKGFKKKSTKEFYRIIEFMTKHENYKYMVCLLLMQTCENDDDFLYFSNLITSKKMEVLNFPSISGYKHRQRITNNQYEILLDALINISALDEVKFTLLQECFFQKKLDEKYRDILINNIQEIFKNDNNYDHSEDALKYLLTLDQTTKNKILKDIKSIFHEERYISIYRNSKKFRLLKLSAEECTTEFISLFLEDQEFMNRLWKNDFLKVLVYAKEDKVLYWINNDQNKMNQWIKNSSLLIIQDNGDINWLDLTKSLLNISKTPSQTLEDIIQNNIFEIKGNIVYSGRWSDVLKQRIPYLTSLKDKLELSHPELLPLIYKKEKELLKMIDIQSKKDDDESRVNNERFDY